MGFRKKKSNAKKKGKKEKKFEPTKRFEIRIAEHYDYIFL